MSELHPHAFSSYARRSGLVFAAVVCCTLLMVATSYARLPNDSIRIALILAGACVNAFLVAAFLMHLISERKMIYTLLLFTLVFFAGLLVLVIWAGQDLPALNPY